MISLNIEKTFGFISKEKVFAYEAEVKAAQEMLEKGTGKGNDFLGWLHLPSSITKEHLADLNATAKVLRDNCEVVIVAGIGGSYLGARAVIEALSNSFTWLQEKKTAPVMIYAGHNISEDYLYELTEYLKDKKFGVINISKSGTTTETALAFRLLKKQCEDQRGKETAKIQTGVTESADCADYIYKLETNIDDCSGEVLGFVMEKLFEAGARDVHYTPVYMKKNRPAWLLTVICKEEDVPGMEALIFAETTSIGIRRARMERTILPRRKRKVMIPFGEVEVKICGSEGAEKCYPEYESLAEICRKTGISYAEAYQMAVDASKNLE